ncbi:MFS transporter [Kibdelosporangium aridum]|uniref:Drug resistance transporter, EmrB/QacA subfamily n=1 Tax=Kibdelosporangium aridum TaxID=2030 RepID=A0A1Y5XEI8_KIBAR|nr:MFS transporter [Kibdelosporangium aridum]SMC89215.1 drug resistance transporter, EmrB/QacA subfamily [Kibdelosporangium aridum]
MGKWSPLVAVCLGGFILLVDVTIVTIALPDMARTLSASLNGLQWVIDAYALALAALVLASGSLADQIGRKRTYLGSLVIFGVASLACGLAPSIEVLVLARAVQGIGGAAMLATTLAIVNVTYHGRDRGVALGIWGVVAGAAAAVGPVAGGLLTEFLGWRWIFLINIPIAIVAIWLTMKVVTESNNPHAKGVDVPGVVTFTAGTGAVTFGLMEAGQHEWGSGRVLGWIAAGVAVLIVFVVLQARSDKAMLDLKLFRQLSFSVILLAAMAFSFAAFAYTPFMSVWLQQRLELQPLSAGLVMLPMSAAALVIAGIFGRHMHLVPFRYTLSIGLGVIGMGALLLTTGDSWIVTLPGLAVAGVGVAVTGQALPGAIMATVPHHRAGMASGALNTFRQLGMAVGVAVLGTVVAHAPTFEGGLETAYVVSGVVGIVVGVVALAFVTSRNAVHNPQVEQVLRTEA